MKFSDYQKLSQQTDISPGDSVEDLMVPLLGLAGETGSLLTEFKKSIRDGDRYRIFSERVQEELGDILWYIANIAHKQNISLEDVARGNIIKVMERWRPNTDGILPGIQRSFDASFPLAEQLPRDFEAVLKQEMVDGRYEVRITVNGEVYGDPLTDNAFREDGYRFHDIFHLSYMGILGWSPVSRRNLRRKRKSDHRIDEVEDGGRAIVIEEAISALVFQYAEGRSFLSGYKAIEYDLLQTIDRISKHLEVQVCAPSQWERAILDGYTAWRKVREQGGGTVKCTGSQLMFVP